MRETAEHQRLQHINRLLKPVTTLIEAPSRLPGLRTIRAGLGAGAFQRCGAGAPALLMPATALAVVGAAWPIGAVLAWGPTLWVVTIATTWLLASVGLGASSDCIDALIERARRRSEGSARPGDEA